MSPRIEELKECITLEQCLFETTGLTEILYRQCCVNVVRIVELNCDMDVDLA